MVYQLEVSLSRVITAHTVKHLCVATLGRDMYLFTDIRFGCDHVKNSVWKVLWMRTCEPKSDFWGSIRNHIHQVGKPWASSISQLEHFRETWCV